MRKLIRIDGQDVCTMAVNDHSLDNVWLRYRTEGQRVEILNIEEKIIYQEVEK